MSSPSLNPKGLAVVCVAFDDETPALVASALALARRTGVELRLVTVLENIFDETWVLDSPMYGVSSSFLRKAQDETRNQRKEQMQALVSSLPSDVPTSWGILSGDIAPAVVADARAHAANFIMTAANLETYGSLMPKGFSVALRLMAEAPLPVLVTSRAHPLCFDAVKPFSILFADDLQAGTEEAARKVFELATCLGRSRIRQVHVHGDFREVLKGAWHDLKERHPALGGADASPDSFLRAEYDARLTALKARGGAQRQAALAAGATIGLEVLTGNVNEGLQQEIEANPPDLVVFGRHQAMKARPYLIGRVGLRAMLGARRAVLVVPPHEQLYAPMPFPVRRDA